MWRVFLFPFGICCTHAVCLDHPKDRQCGFQMARPDAAISASIRSIISVPTCTNSHPCNCVKVRAKENQNSKGERIPQDKNRQKNSTLAGGAKKGKRPIFSFRKGSLGGRPPERPGPHKGLVGEHSEDSLACCGDEGCDRRTGPQKGPSDGFVAGGTIRLTPAPTVAPRALATTSLPSMPTLAAARLAGNADAEK